MNKNLLLLTNISNKLLSINEEEINKGFWYIIEHYNLDDNILGICDNNNGYKVSYPINHIFNFLNNNEHFCIYYSIKKKCLFCNEESINDLSYPSLIPIAFHNIIDNNIKSKVISLTSPYFTRCSKCSYINNNEIITFEEYEKCLICTYSKIKYPHFLILYFDIGIGTDASNLIENKDIISKFISLSFEINQKNYKLVGTINIPFNNHYTATILNYSSIINDFDLNGSFYYDDMHNQPYLEKLEIDNYNE